jgi:hypothetical protein
MPNFSVTIQAIITKTYDVEAVDKWEAMDQAGEQFNCDPETSESSAQEVVDVRKIETKKTAGYNPMNRSGNL